MPQRLTWLVCALDVQKDEAERRLCSGQWKGKTSARNLTRIINMYIQLMSGATDSEHRTLT